MEQAADRLLLHLEDSSMGEIFRTFKENGKAKAMHTVKEFCSLSPKLKMCESILVEYDSIVEFPNMNVPQEISELAKHIGKVAIMASYDEHVLQRLFPKELVEKIQTKLKVIAESLGAFTTTVSVEISNMRELLAKYRPGHMLSQTVRDSGSHFVVVTNHTL